jgi:hypothetical protein
MITSTTDKCNTSCPFPEKKSLIYNRTSSRPIQNRFSDRYKNIGNNLSTDLRELSTLIQIGSVVALFAVGFFPVYFSLQSDKAFRIARGTGAAMAILVPFIFLPTLRMLHAKTYPYIPCLSNNLLARKIFHNRTSFHKYLGCTFLALAITHAAAHTYRHSVSFISQECLTGISMLALSILPIATMYVLSASKLSLKKWSFEKSYYKQFLIPHQIGWWGLVLAYGIHTKDLRLFSAAISITALFCLDRIWEWTESRNAPVTHIERIHDNMIV